MCRRKRKAEQDYLHMKNKKNDGKYVIIDDGTAGGGLFLSENEYYVDENKKVVLCNSEKKIICLERDIN